MPVNAIPDEPITIYYSFHEKDQSWLERLDTHLYGLRRQGSIATWYSGSLAAGVPMLPQILYHWQHAKVIILLISPDYLADEGCHEQMLQAIERAKKALVQVVPILLRPVDLTSTTLQQFTLLPRNGRPIALWQQKDLAFAEIVKSVNHIVERYSMQRYFMNTDNPTKNRDLLPTTTYNPQKESTPSSTKKLDDLPPPYYHSSILQRTEQVESLYTMLIRPDVSSLVLIGLGGIGKSTLAAQVYHYAEEQRLAGKGPFHEKALWIYIKPTLTLKALATKIADSLNQPLPNPIDALPPEDIAITLFHLLNDHMTNRCIILDGIEVWLESQKGTIQAEYTDIGEWLDLLNGSPCASRILLTSRLAPQSRHLYRKMYLRKVILNGLTVQEGTTLLHRWGIEASSQEFAQVIKLCKGHLFALVLLDKTLRNHHISLSTLLHDPIYQNVWISNVGHHLFMNMYEQFDEIQRLVLMAFAADQNVTPWQHVYMRIQRQITEAQFLKYSGTLLKLSFLQIEQNGQEGCYELHPLIARFVQECALSRDKHTKNQSKKKPLIARSLPFTIWLSSWHKIPHLIYQLFVSRNAKSKKA